MSRSQPPKPVVVRLSEMKPGDAGVFFAQLVERTKGQTREAKPYYACKFRDLGRSATAMVWADGPFYEACDTSWEAGGFFKIQATYAEHAKYGPQLDISRVRPVKEEDRADGFHEADFVESSRFDPHAMFAELRGQVERHVADEPLRKLTLGLLDAHADVLKGLPASPRHYHPFPGGWLEHTLAVTTACVWLVDRYRTHYSDAKPPLNKDVVVAAAALHEIGRAVELDAGDDIGQPAEQTVPGRLFGHVILGRDMVRDAAVAQGDVNPALVQLLEHVVLTHLTLPEWGSPRLPLIPEVLILHHADDLDAKLEMYLRCLRKDAGDGPFTERDPVLGRQLFKGREV